MKEGCQCPYCKNNVNERFCITCKYGFNECESIFEAIELHSGDLPKFGYPLCPKCCHKNWKQDVFPGYEIKYKE
jgi:hypothetical protein